MRIILPFISHFASVVFDLVVIANNRDLNINQLADRILDRVALDLNLTQYTDESAYQQRLEISQQVSQII